MAKKKVLLVSGSEICLELLKDYLRDSEVQVFAASDRVTARKLALKIRPEMTVIDQDLADGPGLDLLREFCADTQLAELAVIMLAANDINVVGMNCVNTPIVIGKPLNRRVFLELGRTLLEKIDRRQPRVLCRATVICQLNDETFYGTIEDISPHGMFVGGEREIRIGTELMLKFLLPWQELHLVETRAKVTWSNGLRPRRKSYLPAGFGVEFVNLEPRTLDALNDFITYSLLRQPHVSI